MKIAVAGAGMTGAYLYRLLDKKNFTVHVFDKPAGTRCGITPCAWGISRGFSELVETVGLDPSKYVLKKIDHIVIDGLTIPASLMTIDKPGLVRDLLAGASIHCDLLDPARYDRIIDATGVARAFLPPLKDDLVLPCAQWRLEGGDPDENRIQLGEIGYGWSFPLSGGERHVGCGSLLADPGRVMAKLGWLDHDPGRVRCSCAGAIRLTGPQNGQPFVALHNATEVWGLGEAIGCVAPLAGDGIVSGMKSAQLLLKWWDDASAYTRAILKEFRWMEPEGQVLEKLRKGAPLRLGDAWVLKKNAKRMGMEIGVKEAVSLLRHLR